MESGTANPSRPSDPHNDELRVMRFLADLESRGWMVHIEASLRGVIRVQLRSPDVDIYLP